ncbi:MAG: response regulator, partial [Bdellovibrionales bacterium]|nr:response regulator [Bdellovibrionales bacterium]
MNLSQTSSSIPNGNSQNILIVEDESDVRDLIAIHLKRAGHKVTAVSSVEEARGAFAVSRSDSAAKFDLVVLDWMLPGVSGVEFCRELRRQANRGEVAVLMLTAKSEPQDIVEGLDAGADDYLPKPFESSVLVARVRALSRRFKQADMPTAASSSGSRTTAIETIRLGHL